MPEYAKMKNAELEALLKTRGLPTGGKKADMVDRLTKDDEKKASQPSEGAAAPAKEAAQLEDEIDWDDDEAPAPAAAKPAEPESKTAEKAGGVGQIDNPQAVPNQVADVDSSKTADLSVKSPSKEGAESTEKEEEKKEPPPSYARGLAASSIDEEIEKRKRRAAKFGLNIEDDEGLKKLERAKKFGETGPPKGLDEALPERASRKRERDGNDQGGRGRKQRRGDRFGRRGRGPREGDDRRDERESRRDTGASNRGASWMSEAERRKAEERKKKWAAAPAS